MYTIDMKRSFGPLAVVLLALAPYAATDGSHVSGSGTSSLSTSSMTTARNTTTTLSTTTESSTKSSTTITTTTTSGKASTEDLVPSSSSKTIKLASSGTTATSTSMKSTTQSSSVSSTTSSMESKSDLAPQITSSMSELEIETSSSVSTSMGESSQINTSTSKLETETSSSATTPGEESVVFLMAENGTMTIPSLTPTPTQPTTAQDGNLTSSMEATNNVTSHSVSYTTMPRDDKGAFIPDSWVPGLQTWADNKVYTAWRGQECVGNNSLWDQQYLTVLMTTTRGEVRWQQKDIWKGLIPANTDPLTMYGNPTTSNPYLCCGGCWIGWYDVSVRYWPQPGYNTACLSQITDQRYNDAIRDHMDLDTRVPQNSDWINAKRDEAAISTIGPDKTTTSFIPLITPGPMRRQDTGNQTGPVTLVGPNGFTYTSPYIYLEIPRVNAPDGCGYVGPLLKDVRISVMPDRISSLVPSKPEYWSCFFDYNRAGQINDPDCGNFQLQQFDFGHLPCPPESLRQWGQSTFIYDPAVPYNPIIAGGGLTELQNLAPEYSTCGLNYGWDPFIALVPESSLMPNPTPAAGDNPPQDATPGQNVDSGDPAPTPPPAQSPGESNQTPPTNPPQNPGPLPDHSPAEDNHQEDPTPNAPNNNPQSPSPPHSPSPPNSPNPPAPGNNSPAPQTDPPAQANNPQQDPPSIGSIINNAIGGSDLPPPAAPRPSPPPSGSSFVAGGQTIVVNPSGTFVGGQLLTPGTETTIGGVPIHIPTSKETSPAAAANGPASAHAPGQQNQASSPTPAPAPVGPGFRPAGPGFLPQGPGFLPAGQPVADGSNGVPSGTPSGSPSSTSSPDAIVIGGTTYAIPSTASQSGAGYATPILDGDTPPGVTAVVGPIVSDGVIVGTTTSMVQLGTGDSASGGTGIKVSNATATGGGAGGNGIVAASGASRGLGGLRLRWGVVCGLVALFLGLVL